jgi:osmotically inducible protein OsmC
MNILYTAEGTAWGGREGRAASSDGTLDVQLAIPKSMGGPGGAATNPEQLFALGYAACFHSALKVVAAREKVDVTDSAITARVGIGANDTGGFGLEVELEAELPDVDRAVAEDLVAKAHEVCPYSNATRGNIPVTLTVV